MQNNNLAILMNGLFFKAHVPQRLLTLAQLQENPEQFLTEVFQKNNFEELIKQEFNLETGKLNKEISVKDNEAEELGSQLTQVATNVSTLSDEAARLHTKAKEYFQEHIDNRNVVFKDTCESLQYFYKDGRLAKGIAHQLNNFKNKRINATEDVKVSQTVTHEQLDQIAHLTAKEKRQLQERGGIEVVVESVESQTNLASIVTTFCHMYYSYIEQYLKYKETEDEQQKPLEQQIRLNEMNSNRKQRALMEQIVAGLSPISDGRNIQDIYEFEPLYYLFTGNQSAKMLEFPTTLSMHVFNKVRECLTAISRLKTDGQKQSPKIMRDIANIFPEVLEDDEKATDLNQKWFDWKFDLYSIQQGIIEILNQRVNSKEINTVSSQLNIVANQLNPKAAKLALSMVTQQICAA